MASDFVRRRRVAQPSDGADTAHDSVAFAAGASRNALLVGSSAAMSRVRELVARIARTNITVLITGETGTGKELVALALHTSSARSARPFLCLNCAALPDTLLESELFGHERGAFTGAHEARPGLLRGCDGGTLFLDEVGDLSLLAQAKLLRAIEAKEVQRLGATQSRAVDFRVVAATNRPLEAMVEAGTFRKDLFYRLNVARVQVPPLRDRLDDLPSLIRHYVRLLNDEFGTQIEGVEDDALARLLHHDWPGNVRELRNLLEATFVACPAPRIRAIDLPEYLRPRSRAGTGATEERDRLISALVSVNWNKSRAAERLCWSRMTLYRKMAKHGVTDPTREEANSAATA